jgi:chemotaxis family two-component system sensor kinase Cph1
MKLRDIVNRDLVTLTNCESEPIHIPGAIQPHGLLLALKGSSFIIDFCSANAADYCGATHEQLLGKSFTDCFGSGQTERLTVYLGSEDFRTGNPLRLELGIPYSCTIRQNGPEQLLLEAEPFPDGQKDLPDLYQQTRMFVAMMERSQSLKALCQATAEETKAITGYDRVMIYRFDKDYNGEVIAEAKNEELEPFLNLHYPHTDIPVQARELYLRNLLRMIVDVHYKPVPIYTTDDADDKNLDLSHSVLRSVSPIHIEYLKNMGVGATLTISLIHEKKLWGLITCHHYAAKNIPHYTRLSALLQGHFLTSQIAVREMNEAFEASLDVADALEDLLPEVSHIQGADLGSLVGRKELLNITHATGVAIMFNGQLFSHAELPPAAHIIALGTWLAEGKADYFETDRLADHYDGAASQSSAASGILYLSLSAAGTHYIIWFRHEQKEEVLWAGDPTKAIVKDEKGLSPRKSFEQWRQKTSGQSIPWSDAEQTAAANFAHALQKQLSLVILGAEERRYRMLAEQLQDANDELERINWISTHDLQEPLRKIQVFASRVLGSQAAAEADVNIIHAIERMNAAANRMQTLVTDIHAYSKLLHKDAPLSDTSLDAVVADVLKDLGEELNDKNASVSIDSLPHVNGEPFLLRQVFANLLRNALKFTLPDEQPSIHISAGKLAWTPGLNMPMHDGKYHRVSITDNGIGFDNEFAESIFGLFKRLHTQKEFGGTGIGLALCRKIMERHNGFITAEGEQGKGASFHLWFPA